MTTHIAVANDLASALQALDGYKIYIGCAVWAAMIICAHFGIAIPGAPVDPDGNWLAQLLGVYMVASGRSTATKIISAIGGKQ